jgi:hypothetical protein
MNQILATYILVLSSLIFYFGLFWVFPYLALDKDKKLARKASLLSHAAVFGAGLFIYGIAWSLTTLGVIK